MRKVCTWSQILVLAASLAGLLVTSGLAPDVRGAEAGWAAGFLHSSGPGIANHPVNVIPSGNIRVPADWPVDAGGAITCMTCHVGIPMEQSSSDPMLRGGATGGGRIQEFCAICHASGPSGGGRSMHWMAVRFAHMTPEKDRAMRFSANIDYESKRCLACHDGVNAKDSSASIGHGFSRFGFDDASANHPVGIPYPPRFRNPPRSAYRPASLLPAAVRLPAGQVSCVSCHDLYGGARNLLTVTSEKSKLCFACHDM